MHFTHMKQTQTGTFLEELPRAENIMDNLRPKILLFFSNYQTLK